ncbi:ATP-binding protein [Streptantibioticus silvisoli]|jgi:anti-sigma regulatory factor (Ser/Thr protein kinase)|uniref:ATP-binding protein n=1 Tax=Streptantibioticus silvisoli TaxID=2705255 RepID=UPI003F6CC992
MSMRAKGWARSFPVSGGIRAGRQWARDHLAALGWPADEPETVDAVLLTVSELLTNAHLHAHSTAEMVMSWDGRCLHVSVADRDPHMPTRREPSPTAPGGRGMALVDALADTWEAHSMPGGKTVTACFFPSGQPDPHPADSTPA